MAGFGSLGRRGGAGGGSLRAKTIAASAPLTSGVVATVSTFGLLAPVTFAKTGGNANLTINTSTGAITAAVALAAGASQVLSGTATGADGVRLPFTETLTGAVSAPAAPTIAVTPGNGQNSIAWTDGSNGGASITSHNIYASYAPGVEVLIANVTAASPYVDSGLANGTARYYKVSALNSAGEGALSSEAAGTPVAASPGGTLDFSDPANSGLI